MEDTELSLFDLFALIVRKWRGIALFAIIIAVIAGLIGGVALRLYQMNDPEKVLEWEEEYEAAYGAYHATLNDLDRQIDANNREVLRQQNVIKDLNRQIDVNKNQIATIEDRILTYETRIADYEEDILMYENEIVNQKYYLTYQEEQNANSLYMAIDPYDVKTSEAYIRIDSNYQILPNSTYQDTDPTSEILNTYIMLVNNTEFYEAMIKDLKLNTEVRYLTEVVSIGTYNRNSLRIKVIGSDATTTSNISKYISDKILSMHDRVALSVAEHDVTLYNEKNYSAIDVNIYSRQQENIKKVTNYNASIRDLNMNILNLNTSIRNLNTDIQNSNIRIEEINEVINLIPADIEGVNDEIAKIEDNNFTLRNEKVEFLEEPEPTYQGYTYFSLLTGFVKLAIIGGVLAAIVAVVYIVVIALMSGKVLSSDAVTHTTGANFYGVWPIVRKKKPFAFIDNWVDIMLGEAYKGKTTEDIANIVLSNLAVGTEKQDTVLLCGGADEAIIEDIQGKISKKCPNVKFIIGGTIGTDPRTIEGLAACTAVVLIETRFTSEMKSVYELKRRAKALNKPILGVIVI